MRRTILASAVLLAAAFAAPAAGAVSDFRLPPPTTTQPEPDRQGPVAPDVPESLRPAPAPAPTASRTPSVEPPTSAETPRVVVPEGAEAAAVRMPGRTAPSPQATAQAAPTASDEIPAGPAAAGERGATAAPTFPTASPSPDPRAPSGREEGALWPWIVAAFAVLGALGAAGWAWRRRQTAGASTTLEVERPRPAPSPPAPAPASTATLPSEPLQVALEPLRLSLTLLNATLAYRLEIANRGAVPIAGLRIGADMISAHASLTREQQLSGPGEEAATVQRIERLEPGESRIVEGEFRVPFTQIVPIRQGDAALLLPLARFRLEAAGAAPLVRTFAVGQAGPQARLQPFRLDLGPRVYPKLAQRAFA